jgi:hypothetical protein
MNRNFIVSAAAALLLPVAAAQAGFSIPSSKSDFIASKVYCDEDCAEYAAEVIEERAEAATERAEYAAEMAEEGEYSPRGRTTRRQSAQREKNVRSRTDTSSDQVARKPNAKSDQIPRTSKKDADVDGEKSKASNSNKAVAAAEGATCKKYMPSVGMTLSVPCE